MKKYLITNNFLTNFIVNFIYLVYHNKFFGIMGLTFMLCTPNVGLLLTLPINIHIFIIILGEEEMMEQPHRAPSLSARREIVGAPSILLLTSKELRSVLYKLRYLRSLIQSYFILPTIPIWEDRLWWKWKLAWNHLLLFNSSSSCVECSIKVISFHWVNTRVYNKEG